MLYVGHFSFTQISPRPGKEPWHGLFTLVAEARTLQTAVTKFQRLIHDLAKKHDLFDDVDDVYLDSCVEVRSVPRSGLLTFATLKEGEDTGGLSMSLLASGERNAASYSWGEPDDDESTGSKPVEPFVRFARKRAKISKLSVPQARGRSHKKP
jgi:hypothetical protein